MAWEIKQPNLLIVEGKEEELFFKAFLKEIGLNTIQILPIGGKEKLRPNLKALVSSPGFSNVISLAVIRDANSDPKSAFQRVHDSLVSAKLAAPDKPWETAGQGPRTAIVILPAGDKRGMLEDLCLEAVATDPSLPCVEQYFECLAGSGISLPRNMSKAKAQAFLASREKAGLRLGEAAEAGYWPWEATAFQQIRDFLQKINRS
jgi:hypothetical protein